MPSQIPQEEIDSIYDTIKSVKGYSLNEATRYLEKDPIGYLSSEAIHSYVLYYLTEYATTLGELGEIPLSVAEEIQGITRKDVPFKAADDYEAKIGHDMRGVVKAFQDVLGNEAKSFVYPGFTTYDPLNTAQSLALRDFGRELIIPKTKEYVYNLMEKVEDHIDTVMMGRTHKQHATVTTVAHWAYEIIGGIIPALRNYDHAISELRGKASGFVGNNAARKLLFDTDPEKIDKLFFEKIGLERDDMTGQTVHHYYYQNYLQQLSGICAGIAKFAEDLRNYQQTEVGEMAEKALSNQVGSSTGAHKLNPIKSEQMAGMRIRQMKAYLFAAFDDYITDFQRDLRDSANKRICFHGMGNMAYGTIKIASRVAKNMTIRKEKMLQNIGLTGGLIIAEPLQNALQRYIGFNSEKYGFIDAHEHVREISRSIIDSGEGSFLDAIREDELITKCLNSLDDEKRELILVPEKYIGDSIEAVERKKQEWTEELEKLTA